MPQLDATRYQQFYFSFRTFQVEDTLFRVPKHLFLISNPNIQPIPQDSSDGDDLVILGEDIKKDDFVQLLRAVYPRHFNTPEFLTADQWQAVFNLSRILGMDNARTKAASHLKDEFFAGDPVQALMCAKDNGLTDWIAPLIGKIVETERDPTDEELQKLGIALAMRIARAQGLAAR